MGGTISHDSICPVFMGHILSSRLRKWTTGDPVELLKPHIEPGNRVLDIGSAMGFYTLPAAELTGQDGHVLAIDAQQGMITKLDERVKDAHLEDVVKTLTWTYDVALLIHVLHEVPAKAHHAFVSQIVAALKPGGKLLFAEPGGFHVSTEKWQSEQETLKQCHLDITGPLQLPKSLKLTKKVVLV